MKKTLFIAISLIAILGTAVMSGFAQSKCSEDGSIRKVTAARDGRFETVTFDVLSAAPDYEVTTEKPPFQQYGSEKTMRIRGPHYKSVYFKSVMWMCDIAEQVKPTTNIAAVRNIEQFEGYVNYIIGYRKRGSYVGATKTTVGKNTMIVVKFRR